MRGREREVGEDKWKGEREREKREGGGGTEGVREVWMAAALGMLSPPQLKFRTCGHQWSSQ